ncbi:hypothetical protein BLNAU_13785 [Blattamonas nauphoetae]|uniref:Uncharacterized protein n=1 Tax=Blattamonas nauphoetae TaxID=2049346 RepID=A0ABQ9XFQ4_9EUKA|nr:hypothetical protein BLNAU_13785 [Blattamonas nauphoetae]
MCYEVAYTTTPSKKPAVRIDYLHIISYLQSFNILIIKMKPKCHVPVLLPSVAWQDPKSGAELDAEYAHLIVSANRQQQRRLTSPIARRTSHLDCPSRRCTKQTSSNMSPPVNPLTPRSRRPEQLSAAQPLTDKRQPAENEALMHSLIHLQKHHRASVSVDVVPLPTFCPSMNSSSSLFLRHSASTFLQLSLSFILILPFSNNKAHLRHLNPTQERTSTSGSRLTHTNPHQQHHHSWKAWMSEIGLPLSHHHHSAPPTEKTNQFRRPRWTQSDCLFSSSNITTTNPLFTPPSLLSTTSLPTRLNSLIHNFMLSSKLMMSALGKSRQQQTTILAPHRNQHPLEETNTPTLADHGRDSHTRT